MPLRKLLLVDDDENFNFLSKRVIRKQFPDCEVHVVLNGQEALQHLQQPANMPQAILLDLNMPVVSGYDFLNEYELMRLAQGRPPVFILSSSILQEDRTLSQKHKDVKGFFEKPLTVQHLQQIEALVS